MKLFEFFAAETIKIDPKADLNLDNAPTAVTETTISTLLGGVYWTVGIIAVIVIIIGALRYASANGDSGIIQSAKNTILYAVIGLIVVISAAGITAFVINNVGK